MKNIPCLVAGPDYRKGQLGQDLGPPNFSGPQIVRKIPEDIFLQNGKIKTHLS